MSISPPLGLHYKSNSHPWGPQIVFLVDTNLSEELLKFNTEVSEGEIKLLKALLVIIGEIWPGFWIHLYVTPGIGHVYSAIIQSMFVTEV